MAKTKQQKGAIIDKLEGALRDATSVVFVGFTKINVADETQMRKGFRQEGIKYTVAKKTLIRRALDNIGLSGKDVDIQGEVAVAYDSAGSNDPTGPARKVWAFAKQFGAERIAILGGIFEGKLIDKRAMEEIATIPSMQTLRGMFVNVINSPIAGLAVAIKAIADKRS